jgi:hypothetical protein
MHGNIDISGHQRPLNLRCKNSFPPRLRIDSFRPITCRRDDPFLDPNIWLPRSNRLFHEPRLRQR